jgi:hypothetical protein
MRLITFVLCLLGLSLSTSAKEPPKPRGAKLGRFESLTPVRFVHSDIPWVLGRRWTATQKREGRLSHLVDQLQREVGQEVMVAQGHFQRSPALPGDSAPGLTQLKWVKSGGASTGKFYRQLFIRGDEDKDGLLDPRERRNVRAMEAKLYYDMVNDKAACVLLGYRVSPERDQFEYECEENLSKLVQSFTPELEVETLLFAQIKYLYALLHFGPDKPLPPAPDRQSMVTEVARYNVDDFTFHWNPGIRTIVAKRGETTLRISRQMWDHDLDYWTWPTE